MIKKVEENEIGSTSTSTLLHIDERWREIIEPITLLKDAIDRVRHAEFGEKIAISNADSMLLKKHDIDAEELRKFEKPGTGKITGPINFSHLIIGHFAGGWGSTINKVRIPPWSVLGWQRKYLSNLNHTKNDAAEYLKSRIELSQPVATATCIGGIPLFVSGEGKNRGTYHRRHNFDQLVNLRVASYPNASDLRLQRVALHPHLLVLHYYQNGIRSSNLLPFPQLSMPILEAYGVKQLTSPWCGLFNPFEEVAIPMGNTKFEQFLNRFTLAFGRLSLKSRLFID